MCFISHLYLTISKQKQLQMTQSLDISQKTMINGNLVSVFKGVLELSCPTNGALCYHF